MIAPARLVLVAAIALFTASTLTACGTDTLASGARADATADESIGHSHGSAADGSTWREVVERRKKTCLDSDRFENGRYRCFVDSETVSQFPFDAEPTPEQEATAKQFAERTEAVAESRFEDVDDARAAGYVLDEFEMRLAQVEGTPKEAEMRKRIRKGVTIHLQNPTLANDGIAADPERPDVLMYASDGEQHVLVGAMFLAPIGTDGPQIGGPLTLWHNHDNVADFGMVCFDGTAMTGLVKSAPDGSLGRSAAEGGCEKGGPATGTSQMLHVHFDRSNLEQVFAGNMDPPDIHQILARAERNG